MGLSLHNELDSFVYFFKNETIQNEYPLNEQVMTVFEFHTPTSVGIYNRFEPAIYTLSITQLMTYQYFNQSDNLTFLLTR